MKHAECAGGCDGSLTCRHSQKKLLGTLEGSTVSLKVLPSTAVDKKRKLLFSLVLQSIRPTNFRVRRLNSEQLGHDWTFCLFVCLFVCLHGRLCSAILTTFHDFFFK